MDKDCEITLHYFNARGGGELTRYILAYAKKDFVDHRVSKEEWPTFRAQCPLGQMPVLEFKDKDGKSKLLCQSGAIVRHLATIFNLDGKTTEQKARADEAYESMRELFDAGAHIHMESAPVRRHILYERLKSELAPRIFGLLEKRAKENGGKNIAGGEGYSYADIIVAMLTEDGNSKLIPPEEREKMSQVFPNVFAIGDAINQSEQIKEYLAKRPQTDI